MPSRRSCLAGLTLLLAALSQPGPVAAAEPAPLRVLVFSGQNNHDWTQTTPRLREILTATGRFVVDVTEHPEHGTAEQFAQYDVLLSDWNAWGNVPVKEWPPTMRAAFLDFVRQGGGHVVVHAGGASFLDWTEYQQLIGGTWGQRTGHGAVHPFEVKPAAAGHPITRGLAPFTMTDELWHRMATQPGIRVLATAFSAPDKGGSGNHEPVAFVTSFGQGRCFNLVLGHNVQAMAAPGFQTLLQRGTEWAATGQVTLPVSGLPADAQVAPALQAMATYRFGDSRQPLAAVEKLVNAAAADAVARRQLAARLVVRLSSEGTVEAKQFICGQLSLIGGAAEVPALASLLAEPAVAYEACLALERIPGDEAIAAMQGALATTTGTRRLGLLHSLAQRRAATAVPELARLIGDPDQAMAAAVIAALGRIGNLAAAAALRAAESNLVAALRAPLADALLQCAEGLKNAGNDQEAVALFQHLSQPAWPAHVRSAAFALQIQSLGSSGRGVLLAALTGTDPVRQAAAIRALQAVSQPDLLVAAAGQMENLPVPLQVQLLALCEQRGDSIVRPFVRPAVSHPEEPVRLAAIRTLGAVGNASTVALLAGLLGTGGAAETQAIGDALVRLPGEDVNAALVKSLNESGPAAQRQLMRALVVRGARTAVSALAELTAASDIEVRRQAVAAIGKLGEAPAARQLIQRLEAADANDRAAFEGALIEICERTQSPEPVVEALAAAAAPVRRSLIAVLGAVAGDAALQALRGELPAATGEVRLAVARALSNWPNPAPLDDLVALAVSTNEAAVKPLVLRGVARLAPLARERPDAAAVALQRVLPAAVNVNERKALWTALGSVPSLIALETLAAQLDQPGSREDVAGALLHVAEAIHPWYRAEVKRAIERVKDTVTTAALIQAANALAAKLDAPPNLALGGRATSPDGWEADGEASGDAAAIDGDLKTYWDEENGKPLYRLRIELRRHSTVGFLRLTAWAHHNYAPKDFDVLADDRVVRTVRNARYQNNVLDVEIPPVECTAIELKITGYYGQSPAIRELEAYPPPAVSH